MKDQFKPLNCDNDVLSFSQPEKTYKLGNFREQVKQQFSQNLDNYTRTERLGYISVGERRIYSKELAWSSTLINCEVLSLGSQSWQKGKLRIQVHLERTEVEGYSPSDQSVKIQQVYLEFCPDEPEVTELSPPESPLDDLRQIINQETQQ